MNDPTLRTDHPLNPMRWSAFQKNGLAKKALDVQITLSFQEFLDQVDSVVPVYLRCPPHALKWPSLVTRDQQEASTNDSHPRFFIAQQQETEGTYSNDGGRTVHPTKVEPFEKNMIPLESVLDVFWPDRSLTDTKAMRETTSTEVSWFVNEYYGDTATYVSEQIDLEKLFAILTLENKTAPVRTPDPKQRWIKEMANPPPAAQVTVLQPAHRLKK